MPSDESAPQPWNWFRSKESERVWSLEYSKRIPRDIQERGLMKLQQLNAVGDLKYLSIQSSNQLEALKGDRVVQHPNQQAVADLFKWRDGHAFDVEIVDYY